MNGRAEELLYLILLVVGAFGFILLALPTAILLATLQGLAEWSYALLGVAQQ